MRFEIPHSSCRLGLNVDQQGHWPWFKSVFFGFKQETVTVEGGAKLFHLHSAPKPLDHLGLQAKSRLTDPTLRRMDVRNILRLCLK